jgi:two-component system, OmpR family, sensor histidine kinase VicK
MQKREELQVIYDILSNSIKFTKQGSISISLDKKIGGESGQKNDNNNIVLVSISDRGAGIDHDIQHRLFTKFATGSDKGSGLGLFISKSIIEAHGGRIWAENNKYAKGATFYFSLPIGS